MSGSRVKTLRRRHLRTFNNGLIFSATWLGVTWLPHRITYSIGRAGTWLAFILMRRAARAVIENLRAVYPDRDDRALRILALRSFRSYARDTIDFLRSLSMKREEFAQLVAPVGRPVLDEVLAEGRGAIMATAHFGNWEIGGLVLRHFGYPLTVVVMPEPSAAVNRLRRRFRDAFGIETIEVGQSLDTALRIRRLLSENRAVAMLLDRHLDKDRIAVTLFGRRAYFLRTPALMSYLTGAPLIPSFVLRTADGRYQAFTAEPIRVPRDGDRDERIREAMERFAAVFEAQVRQHPEYWYQFYPYWSEQGAPKSTRRDTTLCSAVAAGLRPAALLVNLRVLSYSSIPAQPGPSASDAIAKPEPVDIPISRP